MFRRTGCGIVTRHPLPSSMHLRSPSLCLPLHTCVIRRVRQEDPQGQGRGRRRQGGVRKKRELRGPGEKGSSEVGLCEPRGRREEREAETRDTGGQDTWLDPGHVLDVDNPGLGNKTSQLNSTNKNLRSRLHTLERLAGAGACLSCRIWMTSLTAVAGLADRTAQRRSKLQLINNISPTFIFIKRAYRYAIV